MNIAIPSKKTIVVVSGGFDPIHIGHISEERRYSLALGCWTNIKRIFNFVK